MKVGFAGVGRMGAAMAERLMETGAEVTVWNRSPARTAPLAEKGAAVADSLASLVDGCEVIVTCLTNADAIEALYNGDGGLLSGPARGRLFIEMSTVRPDVERALEAKVTAAGAAMVECPVGGTVGPARMGKLFGFAGGSDENVARAMPVLEKLCRRVEHVGPVGAGSAMKLAINLPLAVYWQALGEALALCRSLGVDSARLADIMGDTSGGANVMKVRGDAVAEALDGKLVPGTFDLNGLRKDLGLMIEEAAAAGRELPVAATAAACYDKAIAEGLGGYDGPQQSAFWAGVEYAEK